MNQHNFITLMPFSNLPTAYELPGDEKQKL